MAMILVTGASGFVGSFLMEELRRRNLQAVGVSRTPKTGLVQIPTYGAEMDWEPLLKGVDAIVHLAARVHVMNDRARDPLSEFRKVNVEGTLNLARAAARAGVRRFVFVSTIKVNGEKTEPGRPFTANDAPNPQGPYAISKAEAELALIEVGRNTGLEIVIIRPPMVYGPGVKGNMATLARWAKVRLPSPFGTVKNKRTLIHLSNLYSAIIAACHHPRAVNEVFLVGDATSISTHELLVSQGWMKTSPGLDRFLSWTVLMALRLLQSTQGKLLNNLEVDTGKARSLLDWQPLPFVGKGEAGSEND